MKINLICHAIAGTGGGKSVVTSANQLAKMGNSVTVYGEQGSSGEMTQLVRSEVKFGLVKEIEDNADLTLIFNITKNIRPIIKKLHKPKIFRVSCIVDEYEDDLRDPELVKIATTSYTHKICLVHDKNARLLIGPLNTEWYYPDYTSVDRTNLVLFFSRMDGWVGVQVANLIQINYRDLVCVSLGHMGMDSCQVKSIHPIPNMGASAHLIDYSRFMYNKASVFFCAESCGPWGYNNCLMEAMMCKCPVVSTDWADVRDAVIPDVTALTVKGDKCSEILGQDWLVRPDPNDIAERVIELWENKKLAEKLAHNAYAIVREWRAEIWYNKLMHLYEEIR